MTTKTKFVDHYLVLGLPTGEEGVRLTERQITRAFKAKALEVHPDKRPRDQAAAHSDFQNLRESYEILMDVNKREEFNACLRSQPQQPEQWRKIRIPKRPNMSQDFEGGERTERKKRRTFKVQEKMEEFMREVSKFLSEIEKELEQAEEEAESKARK